MTLQGWAQIALYAFVIVVITRPLGGYMTRVFNGERTLLSPVLQPVERLLYRASGIDETREQSWVVYAVAMLFFSVAGFVTLYALQRLQAYLPFNPQGQAGIEQSSAFNTAVSFVSNTNWQSYTPETTMSYLVQMAGLTVHNFLSAATGIALAVALIRGFARRQSNTVGNFWVDMTRCTLYVLLPVSIVVGLFFVWQGMPQNLHPYTEVTTLEGGKQLIAQGPVASQEVIKMFGTNGGGFFNANSVASVREPEPAHEFHSARADLLHRRGAHECVRPDGWRPAAGLGHLRRDGAFVPWRRYALPTGPRARAIRLLPRWASISVRASCSPAAIWKARRSASASRTPRCSRPLPPMRPAAR